MSCISGKVIDDITHVAAKGAILTALERLETVHKRDGLDPCCTLNIMVTIAGRLLEVAQRSSGLTREEVFRLAGQVIDDITVVPEGGFAQPGGSA